MAQRPAELTPLASRRHRFGAELRYWRVRRGLSLAQLGRTLYVSADLIGKVEKAQRWASTALVEECEAVLDTGGLLPRLYALAVGERLASSARARADSSASVTRSAAIIVVVPVYDGVESSHALDQAGPGVPAPSVIRLRRADGAVGSVVDLAAARARRTNRGASGATALAQGR